MERRWVGLVVVIAVLVGGLVAGRLLGPGTAGTAVAEPPPGPPEVGDCLLSRDALPFWIVDNPRAENPPAATIAPCDGERFGEVVTVFAETGDPAAPELAPDCESAAQSYLGLPDPGRTGRSPDGPIWSVASVHLILAAGPDARQRAVGQQWVACLVAPGWQAMDPAADLEDAQVARTLRSAFDDPVLRDRLGYCSTGLPGVGWQVRCDRPHETQAFGFTVLERQVTRAEVEQSCTEWVVRMTGLEDPTDNGAIIVTVTGYDPTTGNTITLDQLKTGSSVECTAGAAVGRLLTGSLLGLDGGPVPWPN